MFAMLAIALTGWAEDGSRLWLRYDTLLTATVEGPECLAAQELRNYYAGDYVRLEIDQTMENGEAYDISGNVIRAGSETGLLYGAYALLRGEHGSSAPRFGLRILNHWDNLDGSIERGYAGKSLWKWDQIDGETKRKSPLDAIRDVSLRSRLVDYCRANASIGINGTVLNNVNASPKMLTSAYLRKVRVLADVFRPYGIRVYLSINFASPMALGYTKTADPLDGKVQQWWQRKAKEIYQMIPDFGGFLVKANSEGQPGPGDYHRTHADGANMLADAVAPWGGIVMWRSFVYGANHKGEDRVKQAVSEFRPMDGKFRENVILQSKNGPLDFQPREPYAPIFDNITQTPQMAELQITQEYLGQSRHLVYLAPMWREFFSFVEPDRLVGVAGVANIGDDVNWCGHHFSQANWYAFGRLAWNPDLSSETIAEEWLEQTWGDDYYFVAVMREAMMRSREACVDYMMPLGLHHIFKFDHHYGPEPDGFKADYPLEWCPVYYHQADSAGVGFDRTVATGSGATAQYAEPYASIYENLETCPDEYLLWFHHVAWDYRMKNGRTLWQNLEEHYNRGCAEVESLLGTWQMMRQCVDEQRWREVDERLRHQCDNAREWRDVCLRYFGQFAKH